MKYKVLALAALTCQALSAMEDERTTFPRSTKEMAIESRGKRDIQRIEDIMENVDTTNQQSIINAIASLKKIRAQSEYMPAINLTVNSVRALEALLH